MSTKRPKKPAKGAPKNYKHAPRKMVAFPPELYDLVAVVAERHTRPVAHEIHHAVKLYLENLGKGG